MAVREKVMISEGDVGTMPVDVLEEKPSLTTVITRVEENLPDTYDFGDYEGGGLEDVGADEMAIPFLTVLQTNSPQCKPVNFGGIEGAKAGMLFNQATSQLFDGERGVGFIPVARDHRYVEFFPREDDGSGGGFVGVRDPNDELIVRLRDEQGQFGKLRYEEGAERSEGRYEPTELSETYSLFGWTVPDWNDPGTASRVVVPFTSTKIGSYKKFIGAAVDIKYRSQKNPNKMTTPPLWSHRYVLRTVYKSKGAYSWYVLDLQLVERPSIKSFIPQNHPFFQMGIELNQSFKTGATRVAYEKMEPEEGAIEGKDTPF